jgi:hypothetical protein
VFAAAARQVQTRCLIRGLPALQVYCRKRPINDKELAAREFDVLTVGPGCCILVTSSARIHSS